MATPVTTLNVPYTLIAPETSADLTTHVQAEVEKIAAAKKAEEEKIAAELKAKQEAEARAKAEAEAQAKAEVEAVKKVIYVNMLARHSEVEDAHILELEIILHKFEREILEPHNLCFLFCFSYT